MLKIASSLIGRSFNLLRGPELRASSSYTSNRGLIRLFNTGSRDVRRGALLNISHRLLSGEINLEKALIIFPDDILTAIRKVWGINGARHAPNAKEFTLEDIAQRSTSPTVLASLAENPEVGLIAAKNPDCPWEAAAKALANMPKEHRKTNSVVAEYDPDKKESGFAAIGNGGFSSDPLDPNYGYFDKSWKHVQDVFLAHPLHMGDIIDYVARRNPALYFTMGITNHP